jgi:hypothetical protein
MQRVGRLVKVLPVALVASALRPSLSDAELVRRIDVLIDHLRATGANLGVDSGAAAVDFAAEPLEARGILAREDGRFRVRDRLVLRYYARSIEHLLPATRAAR